MKTILFAVLLALSSNAFAGVTYDCKTSTGGVVQMQFLDAFTIAMSENRTVQYLKYRKELSDKDLATFVADIPVMGMVINITAKLENAVFQSADSVKASLQISAGGKSEPSSALQCVLKPVR